MGGNRTLSQFSLPVLVSLNGSAHGGVCQGGNQTGIIALETGDCVGNSSSGAAGGGVWISVPCQFVWLELGAPQSHYCDNLVVKYPEPSFVSLGKTKPGSQPLTWEGWE